MKRALAFGALLALTMGVMGFGFGNSCCPPPTEPCCYTSFWVGDTVCFKLVIPWSFFCCTASDELITGWRIETPDGVVVYEHAFSTPVSPKGFEMQWDQKDMSGQQVAAGFYNIVVTTTKGEYKTAIKIVEKDPCCWTVLKSKPCGVSFCKPYIKVYKCPTCYAPKSPCCLPLPCFPWVNCSVNLFFGCCGDDQ